MKPSLGWRLVYFIQRLISRVAPPLHSLHWKILALLLVAIFLPVLYSLVQVRKTIVNSHLRSTEQGMIDLAVVVAETLHRDLSGPLSAADLPEIREIEWRLFKDPSPNFAIVIYDAQGRVLSDTSRQLKPGAELGDQPDVKKALSGKYGALWTRTPNRARTIVKLYSTVPVFRGPEIVGAVSVIKSTEDVTRSILRSFRDLAEPGLLALALTILTASVLSSYLTNVITGLARRADRIAAGEPNVPLETWTKSELGDLARAMESMRRQLEGKAYVDEMVTTFSHELKTPLAAIRGAAEVVEDSADPQTREKFLGNIRSEVDRLTQIVANMLALSRLESQPIGEDECAPAEVARELESIYRPRAEALGLAFGIRIDEPKERIAVPEEELRRLLEVLLDNALQFTPRGRGVNLSIAGRTLEVTDEGVGISADVREHIFDRFATTANPLTGRRGTGLGLAIAKSIVTRHRGTMTVTSTPELGSQFTVKFPEIS